jgi:hypothetical protein
MALKQIDSGENFKIYQDGENKYILIENVRLSFPAIGHMKENKDDDTGKVSRKYAGVPMLSKKSHVDAKDAFVGLMNELMKKNEVKIPPEYRCIKNGDDTDREEYAGHWIISASESRRPTARDSKGKLILDPEKVTDGDEVEAMLDKIDETFFAGCYVNVLLRPWYFNGTAKGATKKFPKRICCGLSAIQFFKKGDPFSQGRINDSEVDWTSAGSDEDEDDLGSSKPNRKKATTVDDDDEL